MKKSLRHLKTKLMYSMITIIFMVLGAVYGYSVALVEYSDQVSNNINFTRASQKRVLGSGISPHYLNPFEFKNIKKTNFPIAQLRGCRNWNECNSYCDETVNYQACVSWSKSIE
jgi:hypothetical protein